MNYRNLSAALLAIVPTLAIGCASPSADEAGTTSDDLSVGLGFSAAVGVIEVGGERICTATLVDVDAHATVGGVSASGREIVLGGACVGHFANGYTGGAVFVTAAAGVAVRTPVAAVNVSGGAGVGILTGVVPGVKPLKPYQGGGGSKATIIRANDDGKQVAAGVDIEVGVDFEIKTKCVDLRWKTAVGVDVAVAGGTNDSFALVSVNGELEFAASIDGGCVVRQLGKTIETIVELPLDVANAILDGLSDIGAGDVIATYDVTDGNSTITVHFYEPASELRLNARGNLSATTQVLPNGKTASCNALIGSCVLAPAGGFKAGETINVAVDASGGLFESHTSILASVD